MTKKPKVFEELERLSCLIPVTFYWTDTNSVIVGVNKIGLKIVGNLSFQDIVGKSPYDMYPDETAKMIDKNTREVVKTGKILIFEESVMDLTTGKQRYYTVTRSPLFERDKVVGTVGITVDITERKEAELLRAEMELQKIKLREQENFKKIVNQAAHDIQSPLAILLILVQNCINQTKEKIFDTLITYSSLVPIGIFWVDVNSVIIGGNECGVNMVGGKKLDALVGKTVYDLYPYDMADEVVRYNNKVMQTGKVLAHIATIRDITTRKIKHLHRFIAPLYDNNGQLVGVVSTSVDVTRERNAEFLEKENELQKTRLDEQDKFKKVADQVVHDICSPLASLLMILKACEKEIPEQTRVALREAAIGIGDIANNLLCKYEKNDSCGDNVPREEEKQQILVPLVLLQILSEKKYQYKDLPLKFTHYFCQHCNYFFINIEFSHFKRMISNLINNAVDALEGKQGEVQIKLHVDNKKVKISIIDNGKGMPQGIRDKIMKNIAITANKKYGHGIGFVQIRDTLRENKGKLDIKSKIGKGTEIIVTFPMVTAPAWLAQEIVLVQGDTVIILDDEASIHNAWDTRFKKYKKDVCLRHFTAGEEAIEFIKSFPKKRKIFLLTDFELLDQELNGLHVVEKTKITRSILVTSHYTNLIVRDLAIKNGTKILPKMFAPEIPIKIINPQDKRRDTTKSVRSTKK